MTKVLQYIIVCYAFFVPLSRAGIVFFSMILIVSWLFEAGFQKKYRLLSQSKVILSLFAFLLFNVIALLWSDDIFNAYKYILKYWYFLPIVVLFTSLQKEYVSKVLSAFIAGMLLSEIISYGIFFEIWDFNGATSKNPSPFMHHIEYSIFLAFTALILLGRMFNHQDTKYKIVYSLFFITITGNLFLNAGRTGQVAFLLGIFVLALLSFKNKLKAFVVFILLTTIISLFALNFSSTFKTRITQGKENLVQAVEQQEYCSSLGSRVGACIVASDMVTDNLILGVGIVDNMQVFHQRIDEKYPKMKCLHPIFMHMHNQFFQITTQLGIIGLLIFLTLFYTIFRLPIRSEEYKNIKYTYVILLMFSFIPEVLFHRQFSMALFTLIVGLLLAQYRIENEV